MLRLIYISVLGIILVSCNKQNKTYSLGKDAFGGIVIQLDETKQHGLVIAKTDQVTFAMHKNWQDSKAIVEAYSEGGDGWRMPTKT